MTQVYKRNMVEQVKALFQGYLQGNFPRGEAVSVFEIGKTRFFALMEAYQKDPATFSMAYQSSATNRHSERAE